MQIKAKDANEAFIRLNAALVMNADQDIVVRGLRTKELINCNIHIREPYSRVVTLYRRRINMRYLMGELCWYLDGSDRTERIATYSKFWNKISDDGFTANSAYGKRLFFTHSSNVACQLTYVVEELIADNFSRKAIMTIYDFQTDSKKSKDNPCTLSLQFLIRNKRLDMITTMRSNDLFFGFTYDIPFFTLVQEIVMVTLQKHKVDVHMGSYYHNVGSMHLYEKDFVKAEEVLNDKGINSALSKEMPHLVEADVSYWFNDLLIFETSQRTNSGYTPPFNEPTPFQSYGIKYLKEENNG